MEPHTPGEQGILCHSRDGKDVPGMRPRLTPIHGRYSEITSKASQDEHSSASLSGVD